MVSLGDLLPLDSPRLGGLCLWRSTDSGRGTPLLQNSSGEAGAEISGPQVRSSLASSGMQKSHAASLGGKDMARFAFGTVALEAEGRGAEAAQGRAGGFFVPASSSAQCSCLVSQLLLRNKQPQTCSLKKPPFCGVLGSLLPGPARRFPLGLLTCVQRAGGFRAADGLGWPRLCVRWSARGTSLVLCGSCHLAVSERARDQCAPTLSLLHFCRGWASNPTL